MVYDDHHVLLILTPSSFSEPNDLNSLLSNAKKYHESVEVEGVKYYFMNAQRFSNKYAHTYL